MFPPAVVRVMRLTPEKKPEIVIISTSVRCVVLSEVPQVPLAQSGSVVSTAFEYLQSQCAHFKCTEQSLSHPHYLIVPLASKASFCVFLIHGSTRVHCMHAMNPASELHAMDADVCVQVKSQDERDSFSRLSSPLPKGAITLALYRQTQEIARTHALHDGSSSNDSSG